MPPIPTASVALFLGWSVNVAGLAAAALSFWMPDLSYRLAAFGCMAGTTALYLATGGPYHAES